MDKLRLLGSYSWCRLCVCRLSTLCGRFYSSTSTSYPDAGDSIYLRISRAGRPTNSMAAILEQWLEEGRSLKQSDLQRIVKQLRKYNRFRHALQVSEYMTDQMNHPLSPGNVAIRLDLISKVHGLEQAEIYFDGIPDGLRGLQVYGALLNCYAAHKSLEKAEQLMQKMRELGFPITTLSYNVMLKLYFELGKFEKLDALVQEMEQSGVGHDKFTLNIRLNAYGATADIEGMEKLLSKMACDPRHHTLDWSVYVAAGKWYLKTGFIEKGLTMLRKAEQTISDKSKRSAYEIILTLYAAAREKNEVYRMWSLCKNLGKVYNSSYLCMISTLMKLDDVDGAERIFEEWESVKEVFDARLPNVMITAYCRKGLLEKAEVYMNRLVEGGKEPDATTWDRLATGYCENGRMAESVETMKKAILAGRPGWPPNRVTLAACLDYLQREGDVGEAEGLLKLLNERGYDQVVSDIGKGNLGFQALDQMD